jgi:hypothetical protein
MHLLAEQCVTAAAVADTWNGKNREYMSQQKYHCTAQNGWDSLLLLGFG